MDWSEEARRLRALTGAKWSCYPPDVLPAWVADMDFPTAPPVVDALRQLVDASDLGYNLGLAQRIPSVFCERQERRFGWRPDVERVRIFCDVMQAVEAALWLHTSPGDGVVLLTPVYAPFYRAIESCRCRLIDVPLQREGWRLDLDALRRAMDDQEARAIILCNPHNPSGRVFTREELLSVAEFAEEFDLLVISDEIWEDLAFPPAVHIPCASLSAEAESRTVTVTAASKAFNLAGLRCAVAHVGHRGVWEGLEALPGHLMGAVGSPGAAATLAAWTRGDDWLKETVARLKANRDHLAIRLRDQLPAVRFASPEGTYLAWLDFSMCGLGDDPAQRLMEDARVAVSRGLDFGAGGRGFGRLNFATTPAILDEIIERIIAVDGI